MRWLEVWGDEGFGVAAGAGKVNDGGRVVVTVRGQDSASLVLPQPFSLSPTPQGCLYALLRNRTLIL